MAKVPISARVDEVLKNAIERHCKSRGIVMNHFIQEALIDRLEELEDVEDLMRLRHEPTRPLREVLRELELNGQACSRNFARGGAEAQEALSDRPGTGRPCDAGTGGRPLPEGCEEALGI